MFNKFQKDLQIKQSQQLETLIKKCSGTHFAKD